MKANEAPEKIILSADKETGILYDEWVIRDLTDSIKIEYTRTDAFIEKAIKFFAPYIQDNSGGYDRANVIENFRKTMKL